MTPEDRERLLRWHPQSWRSRYGEELSAMVEDGIGSKPPA